MTDEHHPETPPTPPNQDDTLNPMLVVFLIVPLLSIVAALVMVAMDLQSQRVTTPNTVFENTNPATLINSQAPEFELSDLNGQPVTIGDYQGKIVFLNFWQTTCPPCIEEMPDFIDFISDQPDDVTWLTVNFDETDQQVREFFAEYDLLGIPTVMDYDSQVRYRYGVFGAPVTFVLDKDGIIQYMNIGQLSYDDMEQLVDGVRENT